MIEKVLENAEEAGSALYLALGNYRAALPTQSWLLTDHLFHGKLKVCLLPGQVCRNRGDWSSTKKTL